MDSGHCAMERRGREPRFIAEMTEPSPGPPPSYLRLIRFGPWALCLFGLVLLVSGLSVDRPVALQIALAMLGTGCFAGGVLLPRIKGIVSMSKSGIEADVLPAADLDRTIAAVAADVARKAIPDEDPQKHRRVQEFIDDARQTWAGTGTLAGTWWALICAHGEEPEKLDLVTLVPSDEDLQAAVRRTRPEDQNQRRWEFVGKVRGNFIFGMFFTSTPDINALSYGTIQGKFKRSLQRQQHYSTRLRSSSYVVDEAWR